MYHKLESGTEHYSMKSGTNQSSIFEKVIRSDKDEAKNLIGEALAYFKELQKSGLAREISEFNFRLALDEAIENAISHGNKFDASKKIHLTIQGFKNKIDMTIEDEGNGFKPEADPQTALQRNLFASHGRGLCLLKTLGTILWNRKGNSINVVLKD